MSSRSGTSNPNPNPNPNPNLSQENEFAKWYLLPANNFKQFYIKGAALYNSMWPTIEPTALISSMFLNELLTLLIFDGIRIILPIILVFLIVWLQTRSLFIALVTVST